MKHSFRSLLALAIASAPLLQAQGPLTPPGAPAPTMKALDQVEPRRASFASTSPWVNFSF
jgi:hypothetical protein